MMKLLDPFQHAFVLAALSIALLGTGAAQAADAHQQGGRPVALAFDAGTQSLLKAYPDGLYRSSDWGQSWQGISVASVGDGQIASIAASPAGKGVIYAAGPGFGVVRSDDGGKTWAERNEGLPSHDVIAVAAHTTQPDTVYAFVTDKGIYRSQDAGKSWRLMDRGPRPDLSQLVHSDMAGSMQSGWLFAATPTGIRRIMDCFCLWQDAGGLGSGAYSVTYDPRQPDQLYTATEKGLFRSTDGGESWVQTSAPGGKVVALAFARSGTLFALNEDGTLFTSADQGATWKQVNA
jgi:photosystem II stability/assembly factor-like uncharacterized protein